MARTEREKALREDYKTRAVVGGVCLIKNTVTGRCYLIPAQRPEAQRNRLQFSQSTDSCLHPAMAADWREHGGDSFTFSCLETLEKRPEQTDGEFREELNLLAEIWRDRLVAEGTVFYCT